MPNVTLTIEATVDELQGVLRQLLGVAVTDAVQPEPGGEDWTDEEMAAFLTLITSDAAGILRKIAERPEDYPWDELQEELGLSGTAMAGRMSSIGHALRRFPEKKPIHVRDYQRRAYRMDPEVAQLIRNSA